MIKKYLFKKLNIKLNLYMIHIQKHLQHTILLKMSGRSITTARLTNEINKNPQFGKLLIEVFQDIEKDFGGVQAPLILGKRYFGLDIIEGSDNEETRKENERRLDTLKNRLSKKLRKKKPKHPAYKATDVVANKSAYLIFSSEYHAMKNKSKDSKLSAAERSAELSVQWADIKKNKKLIEKYNKLAMEDKKRYEKEYEESKQRAVEEGRYTLPPPPKPKGPLTPYFQFSTNSKIRDKVSKSTGTTGKLLTTELGKVWKKMSIKQKSLYQKLYLEDKKRYQEELKEYNEKYNKEEQSYDENANEPSDNQSDIVSEGGNDIAVDDTENTNDEVVDNTDENINDIIADLNNDTNNEVEEVEEPPKPVKKVKKRRANRRRKKANA